MNSTSTVPATDGLDHGSDAYILIIAIVVCLFSGTLAVGLRIYTRWVLVNQMWIDDYLAIFSWMLLVAIGIVFGIQTTHGVGSHVWDIPVPDGMIQFKRDTFISLLFYNVSLLFIKLMFFFQYYRIVAKIQKLRIIYIVVMVLVSVWTVGQIFITAFTCVPIEELFDDRVPPKHCNSLGPVTQILMNSIGNIVTDVIILLLPLPVVWRLKLSRKQKWALLGVFSLGFFTCIISSFRLVFTGFQDDITYHAVGVTSWTIAELASGIVCAAAPTLRPLMSRYFSDFGSQNKSTKGYQVYNYGSKPKDTAFSKSTRLQSRETGIYADNDMEIELVFQGSSKVSDLEGSHSSEHDLR